MSRFSIKGNLVLPDSILFRGILVVEDGRIAAIDSQPPPDSELIDATGRYVLPGLIDIHCHGRLAMPDPKTAAQDLAQDSRELPATGVTRFLPTLASAPVPAWLAVLAALSDALSSPPAGAAPLGIHLEGVFLNPEAAGAHPPSLLVPFDQHNPDHRAIFERWGNLIKMVTLAPEVPGNLDLARLLIERGIVPALGHSAAGPAEVHAFAELGVRHMTHLFNGMKPMNHRDPGPALAGLLDQRVSVDLIADGVHLHPEVVRLIHHLKPEEKRFLITDLVSNFPGAIPGEPDLPNRLPNGGLAGSRLRLCRAVKNYHDFTSCPLPQAVAMASLYPAALLGLDRVLGSLEAGKLADFFIAGPDLVPQTVFIAGKKFETAS